MHYLERFGFLAARFAMKMLISVTHEWLGCPIGHVPPDNPIFIKLDSNAFFLFQAHWRLFNSSCRIDLLVSHRSIVRSFRRMDSVLFAPAKRIVAWHVALCERRWILPHIGKDKDAESKLYHFHKISQTSKEWCFGSHARFRQQMLLRWWCLFRVDQTNSWYRDKGEFQ